MLIQVYLFPSSQCSSTETSQKILVFLKCSYGICEIWQSRLECLKHTVKSQQLTHLVLFHTAPINQLVFTTFFVCVFGMGGFGWGFLLLSFCFKLTAVRILAPHQRAPRNPTQLKHSSQPNSQKYYLPIYFFLNVPHNKTTHKSLSHPAT